MQVKIVAAAASPGNDVMGSAQTEWNVFLVSSIKYITVGIILRQLQGSTSRKVICRKINDSSHIANNPINHLKWLVLYPVLTCAAISSSLLSKVFTTVILPSIAIRVIPPALQ